MSLLEITHLSVAYGRVVAVRDLDLAVERGSVTVVAGVNGAGKSSLINAISGLAPVTSGRITFAGNPIHGRPAHTIARAGVIQVPEGRQVFAPLSVEDNLLIGGHSVPRRQRQKVLDEVWDLFPVLADKRGVASGLLSGGQQQMVAFGRALMSDPKILLLDEPSMGLAPIVVDAVIEAVRSIAARGISILLVEQNAEAAFSVADTAYVLENGHVVLHGPAAEVAANPRVLQAFLGLDETSAMGEFPAPPAPTAELD